MTYDYDVCEDEDAEHLYEIFEVKGGKVVGYADSREEASEKISELERKQ